MSHSAERPSVCWVVTDGRLGNESQAMGLAEAIAERTPLSIVAKRIRVESPWRRLGRGALSRPESNLLSPPYPDVWIGCGKLAVPLTIAVKRKHASTFTIQIQNPRARLSLFDLVVAPAHDRLAGGNVISIVGSPNRLRSRNAPSPSGAPKVAVLIGGPNRAFRLTRRDAARIGAELRTLAQSGAALSVTTSRRTPASAAEALAESLRGTTAMLWRAGADDWTRNPYPAMLDDADAILITEDSVNMAAEAATTGRPLYLLRLTRKPFASAQKFDAFHEALRARGALRPFEGAIEGWTYEPLCETARAADEIVKRWKASQLRVR